MFVQEKTPARLGKRHLVCSAGGGTLVWPGGLAAAPDGWRLLLVGHPRTELLHMGGQALRDLVDEDALAAAVRPFVTTVGLRSRTAQPDGARDLAAPTPPSANGHPLVDAHDAFRTAVADTVRRVQDEEEAESGRIAQHHRLTELQMDAELSGLAGVVDVRAPEGTASADDHLRQLDVALARIGREIGVDFPAHAGLERHAENPVALRVLGADCRLRVVTMTGGWWSHPATPLLAFIAESRRPVALLPKRGGHVFFDPLTGTTRPVTAEVAASLHPRSYVIYPPLPTEASSPRALLRAVLARRRGTVGLVALLGALAGLVAIATPIATSLIYTKVLPQNDKGLLVAVAALLIGAAMAWALTTLSQNLSALRFEGLTAMRLDSAVMDRILQLPSDFFRRYGTGDLATRAGGLQVIREQLSGPALTALLTLVFSVSSLVIMFVYSVPLALVALVILVASLFVLVRLNVGSMKHQWRAYDHTGDIAGDLFQVVQGIEKVRAAGAAPRVAARWAREFRLQAAENFAAGRNQALIVALVAALPAVLAFALYLVTITLLDNGIDAGDFVALLTALGQFTAGLSAVALAAGPLLTVIPLWERLRPILEEPLEDYGERDPGALSGLVEMRNVSFEYGPDAQVLENVSLRAEPGEFIALTGPSGSGKSTLLRLLLGLDTPTSGTVLYDGKDLQVLDPRAVRRQIGVVMQQGRPLPGEIRSIILGDAPGGESDAWAAAEAAELADDIRGMPMGMRTIVGEGGAAFSGGQMQRMMIARALARAPRLMILDEATSALDDRTQARVSTRLDELRSTRIMIAHRLSTIRNADRIYVLEEGRIAEVGTYDELMEKDGLFRRLAARQIT